ncbi:MAG: hypothetical protein EP343_09500 [Deltaproteobacteria bacterium]|nr:MAG: hypothetical protein EP343_09500 [Deltaproteobacteria bacterium]
MLRSLRFSTTLLSCWLGVVWFVTCLSPSLGWAEGKPQSSKQAESSSQTKNRLPGERTTPSKAATQTKAGNVNKKPDPHRVEWGILPAIAYDSDTGFGFGLVGTLAKFHPKFSPYRWRLEALIFMTLKVDDKGQVTLPFHDDYLIMDFPGLANQRLRLTGKVGFARYSNAGYYGFGAASSFEQEKVKANPQTYQYDRIYPNASLNARLDLLRQGQHKLQLFLGTTFVYNWINVYQGSVLESELEQRKEASEKGQFLQATLLGVTSHPLWLFEVGLIYDSRNHEYAPSSGMFHEVSFRGSPGIAERLYFGGVNATARFYVPLWKEYLVFAARLMADVLFGNVPFYEQARYGGFFPKDGPGGGYAVRGVPLHRHHGKIKLIGNLELRSKIVGFSIAGERFNIGITGFFDAGRVWSDASLASESLYQQLDGNGAILKYGAGGGLRIQWGETFIIRADFSYSPLDDNVGVYIDVNHIF